MLPKRISRRAFIRLGLLGGIGAGTAILQHQTSSVGLWNYLRWITRGGIQEIMPAATVGLQKCMSYEDDLVSKLRELWKYSGMPRIKGKKLLVKPNLLDQVNGDIATTSPKIISAILELLAELEVGEVVVGDGSAFCHDTHSLARRFGLLQVLSERNVPFIDLNYDELVKVPARDGWIRSADHLWLPRHAVEADYILSVPKLKTHHWAGVTLSMKNLLGIIPGSRYGWPKNIIHVNGVNASILGLFQSLPPVISLIDGIIGMEGNGPLFGTPVQHGLLAAGADPVAVDSVCVQLMGFESESIGHLSGAAWAGIGQARKIETRGVSREELQKYYQAAPTE